MSSEALWHNPTAPAHVSTRLVVIIYTLCVCDMSFFFVFNECFIFVGPIFPLEHQRPLKVGFLLFLSLCLMTVCPVWDSAQKGEDRVGFPKTTRSLAAVPQRCKTVFAHVALLLLICAEWSLLQPSPWSCYPSQLSDGVFEKGVAQSSSRGFYPGCPHSAPQFHHAQCDQIVK